MTRKESLAVEFFNLKNEFNSLSPDMTHRWNVEKMLETGEIKNFVRRKTEDELEHYVLNLQNSILRSRQEKENKDYLQTEEGKEALASIDYKKESLQFEIEALKSDTKKEVDELLAKNVGNEFKVRTLFSNSAEIGLDPGHQFNRVDVRFAKNGWAGEEEFTINCGSTGSFEIGSERAKFYALLGKFLSSPVQEEVKAKLLDFNEKLEKLGVEYRKLDSEVKMLGVTSK